MLSRGGRQLDIIVQIGKVTPSLLHEQSTPRYLSAAEVRRVYHPGLILISLSSARIPESRKRYAYIFRNVFIY